MTVAAVYDFDDIRARLDKAERKVDVTIAVTIDPTWIDSEALADELATALELRLDAYRAADRLSSAGLEGAPSFSWATPVTPETDESYRNRLLAVLPQPPSGEIDAYADVRLNIQIAGPFCLDAIGAGMKLRRYGTTAKEG